MYAFIRPSIFILGPILCLLVSQVYGVGNHQAPDLLIIEQDTVEIHTYPYLGFLCKRTDREIPGMRRRATTKDHSEFITYFFYHSEVESTDSFT
ncbi:MAG: hypothetical protein AAF587_20605 [Bacteroidota bacterium]